jgi:hypothetical protein
VASPILTTRLQRRYRQTLCAPPQRVFPLLCPEREREWLPGWEARWIHSASGLAEAGAVFATRDGAADAADEVIWVVAAHRPPAHVHFVRWHPRRMVVDLKLDLQAAGAAAAPGSTWLDIEYTYTALSPAGAARIEAMTEAQWREQMTFWEESLNRWLAAHA